MTNMAIDIGKLKQHKTSGTPFMEFLPASIVGQECAYAVEALEEPRVVHNKEYARDEKHVRFALRGVAPEGVAIPRMKSKPGEFLEIGKTYVANITKHKVLGGQFLDNEPIMGKLFHVMNRGTVQGKKNDYTDYAVLVVAGEKHLSVDELVIVNPEVADYDPDSCLYAEYEETSQAGALGI